MTDITTDRPAPATTATPRQTTVYQNPTHQTLAHPFAALRAEMDRLFEEFSSGFGLPGFTRGWTVPSFTGTFAATPFKTPMVDVTEDDKSYFITAELPGLSDTDVDLSLSGDLLMLRAEKKIESANDHANVHVRERSYGSFVRTFQVPEDVAADKIDAKFTHGVLRIEMPKSEVRKPATRTIAVKASA